MPNPIDRIAGLSKEKQALLLQRLKQKPASASHAIARRPDFSPCPLSFAQERLWFLAQMEPENPFYNMAGTVLLQGNLNVPVLAQALNAVVSRHEALRTSFKIVDGEVRQVIDAATAVPVGLVDLSALDGTRQPYVVQTLARQEARGVFDLGQTPLLRAVLLKLDDRRHVLLATLHHIVADEWSLRLLIKEIGVCYRDFSNGVPLTMPELPVQYADFAVWQRKRLQGEMYDRQIAYWRQHLASAPAALELPAGRTRPALMSYRGAEHEWMLGQDVSAALTGLSRQAGTTLFALMMAAFNILLSRYTGQSDICVGYPVANRNHREIESLIGFFVNTLVLRTDLSGDPTFAELLAGVNRHLLEAQNNQDLPFERLVEELGTDRALNRTLLFQAMLVYQNEAMEVLDVPGLSVEMADAEIGAAKFDLTLTVKRSKNALRCSFNYSSDLFDAGTIAGMAGHWEQLLESIAGSSDSVAVADLQILTPEENRRILFDWNATETDYPKNRFIHQLFEAQVEKTPDAVALVFQEQVLTYAELNARANQLAHHLLAERVGPDVLVGLCMQRSPEMVIGLLGILKAGAAYLPLDPDYPAARLAFMLADIKPPVVLTHAALLEKHSFETAAVLCLDRDWQQLADGIDANPDIVLRPENLAYCIYTSGSTGQPKGAGVPHRGILNRLQWMQQQYRLAAGDCVLQKTPYSFDVSVWEFFWPLMTGAKLVVAMPGEHKNSQALIDTVRQHQVTTIHFVPSMLQAFVDTPGVETCVSLKHVICSGEALPADLAARFRQKLPAALHNLYGPTEASVDVSYWECLPDDPAAAIPIGRPIANIELYILDRRLNPVPVGVPGELHIGGIGLGRCYLNRPGLTAEKFIPNPYGLAGSRLYKTGDLASYRADGNIDYLGRIDHQVKIRGFRIELGEIEARLLEHPDIKEAVVLAREDQPGDKRLVAYLVVSDGATVQAAELRALLLATLADYMVPASFVTLPALPLSANGKLDRKALPAPDAALVASRVYEEPQGPVETAVAGIWQDLLGVAQVGRHDNFFEMGGHSLMLVGLIEPLRRQGYTVDMRMIFASPTVAGMAEAISNAGNRADADELPNPMPDHFSQPLTHNTIEEFRL
ncbi:non-ribosomal peptide synthetase [Methylomicrobium album]|uniref:Amino acid adenylation enzyme/thioester reductase family protein n=1 Tax=Methylomicrobium album BG8 TaxID=686340 RepID=H8GJ89_METAL|nr:non-ribosomal peptide synthetase [Methylomicrobium album]EIC29079.1 amino acid adenylation enzyme/thioester reductase family protein [Methylomicrobium album BG8]